VIASSGRVTDLMVAERKDKLKEEASNYVWKLLSSEHSYVTSEHYATGIQTLRDNVINQASDLQFVPPSELNSEIGFVPDMNKLLKPVVHERFQKQLKLIISV
jgi:hypothetical protein